MNFDEAERTAIEEQIHAKIAEMNMSNEARKARLISDHANGGPEPIGALLQQLDLDEETGEEAMEDRRNLAYAYTYLVSRENEYVLAAAEDRAATAAVQAAALRREAHYWEGTDGLDAFNAALAALDMAAQCARALANVAPQCALDPRPPTRCNWLTAIDTSMPK